MRSALIIHPGGLGDVLLAVPAMQAIRSCYRTHELTLLAGTEIGQLLQICGIIDQALSIEAGHLAALFSGTQRLSPQLEKIVTCCDFVVAWLSDADGTLQSSLQGRGISRLVVRPPGSVTGGHQSDRFLACMESLIGRSSDWPSPLALPASLLEDGRAELKKIGLDESDRVIVCHPGSGSRHKCVRARILLDVLAGCRERALIPVVVEGPADEKAVQALREEGMEGVPVVRPPNPVALAGILAVARAYIGHDSGVTHLSAQLGIPTLALFGPTDPLRWSPRGAHVSILAGSQCLCSGWQAVQGCVAKPCLDIQAREILPLLDGLLSRYHRVTNS